MNLTQDLNLNTQRNLSNIRECGFLFGFVFVFSDCSLCIKGSNKFPVYGKEKYC